MRFLIQLIKCLLETFIKLVEKENTNDIERDYEETLKKVRLARQELDKTEEGIRRWRQRTTTR
jgi:hypothetical protein